MLKVNNKKVIKKLAISSFRKDKLRNIFAIIAITLTTILFTSLFTIGTSLLVSLQHSTMRQVGGSSHGTFKNISKEEYEKISEHKSIKNIGYSVVLGFAENQDLIKRPTEIRYTSGKWQAQNMFAYPTTGRLPQKENEIATDTIVLERLGIPCKLGQEITIEYSLNNKKERGTFRLVGFWNGDIAIPASEIWLSPTYVKNQLINYKGDNTYGSINADVCFSNSLFIKDKMEKVIEDCGLSDIDYGVNWAYLGNSDGFDLSTVFSILAMLTLIGFSGYLIISNIFYISISKDIRFYGLLKAVGTTSRQIKKIIKIQALLLCLFGIPIGLFFGYIIGKILTPIILSILNTTSIIISINPFIFIGAAIFSIITVVISIKKPSKIAGKVSAIEALRNSDNSAKTKYVTKKSKKITMYRLASENVFRNKKKMLKVVTSLSLSLIILNSSYSIANGFDMDKYLSNSIIKDFSVADAAYYNIYKCYGGEQTLSKKFLTELYSYNGIKETGNIFFKEFDYFVDSNIKNAVNKAIKEFNMSEQKAEIFKNEIKQKNLTVQYYGLDSSILDELNYFQGNPDKEKFMSGKYIIANAFDSSGKVPYYNIGDKVTIDYPNGTGKEYEVMAIANIPYPISYRGVKFVDINFYVPSKEFINNIDDIAPMLTTFDVSPESAMEIENFLSNYCNNVNKDMQYASKLTFAKEFEGLKNTYLSVGIVLSFILAFIGIINFTNTIVTSLIARRRELATLQSIGMTNKQLKRMFIFEGLVYIFLTSVFTLTLGSVIGYAGVNKAMSNNIAFTTNFTVIPSIICLPILALISVLVPFISQKIVGKSSIVERLREIE